MANMNQMEFNAIRELVGGHQTICKKLSTYATQCTDPEIKTMFQNASKEAMMSAQKLIDML